MSRGGTLLLAAAFAAGGCERAAEPPPPLRAEPVQFQRTSADEVAHGERLSAVLGCTGCHGADLAGQDWSEPGWGRMWTANLSRAVPRYSDAQLATIIRGGHNGRRELWEMPSHLFTQLSAADMAPLIAFLRSKPATGREHPEPVFEPATRKEIASGAFLSSRAQAARDGDLWPPDAGADHAFGRYIARATCAECHGLDLAGGVPFPGATPRPDLKVMVPAYDAQQFRTLLRTGKAIGDRDVGLMSEVARGRYSRLTEAELQALYAYLKTTGEAAR